MAKYVPPKPADLDWYRTQSTVRASLFTSSPPSTLDWHPMRPSVHCPYCNRKGRVQRRMGVKSYVEHRCPGPFVLAKVETDYNDARATFEVRVTPRSTP